MTRNLTFNSLCGVAFLALAAILCRLAPRRARRAVMLLASLAFYACFDVRMLPVLCASILCAYGFGLAVATRRHRRAWLAVGLVCHFGLLFFCKYLNFFASGLSLLLTACGLPPLGRVTLALPVGISFFTFMICGYLIDVYRGKIPAERNILTFGLFVAFFPQITSGPIGRADALLPQLRAPKAADWEDFSQGTLLFAWGLFLKMVLADHLAAAVNAVYAAQATGLETLAGAAMYSLQIYCDFAGYSLLAIGAARTMGVRLMENFRAPYLATSCQDFWRRWHISLSTWFRDYLYFPLGGSRCGRVRQALNVLIVFTVSGLWHGAALTFLIWGALNGVYQVLGRLLAPVRKKIHLPRGLSRAVQLLWTFGLETVAWVFFRADNLAMAGQLLQRMGRLLARPDAWGFSLASFGIGWRDVLVLALGLAALLVVDMLGERKPVRERLAAKMWLRWGAVAVLICVVLLFGWYGAGFDAQEFVYFKF